MAMRESSFVIIGLICPIKIQFAGKIPSKTADVISPAILKSLSSTLKWSDHLGQRNHFQVELVSRLTSIKVAWI